MKKTRENKGITLIALVITIIVLLILAGVAIAMLSGENGILKKAAEAKTKTEESQKAELTSLSDMELLMNSANNSRYNIKNGYITGVEFKLVNDDTLKVKSTISDLEDSLQGEEYYVVPKGRENAKKGEITEEEKNQTLTTGVAVKKGDEVIARVVIFGDINCDGEIQPGDSTAILQYIKDFNGARSKFEDYQIAAMDIYNDGYIGTEDSTIILEICSSYYDLDDMRRYQNAEAKLQDKLIVKAYKEAMETYVNGLTPKDDLYKWEWLEKKEEFRITGNMTEETTGNSILESLGLTGKAKIIRINEDGDEVEITTESVENDDEIRLKNKEILYGHRLGYKNGYIATIYKK